MDNGNRLIGIDGKKPLILVVDDTPSNLVVISTIIEDEGGEVRVAKNGPTALRLAQLLPHPDLILLDIMMPEMDGHMILGELRKNPQTRDIPVIFVTAMNDPEEEERGISEGAADFIAKPVKPAVLIARVRAQIELSRAQQLLSSQKSWLETEVARQVGANARLENRLQMTLEGTGFGIWEHDLLTRRHRWSEGLRQLFGYAEEPATIDDYLALVHPEDRPLVEAQLLAPHSHGTPSTLAEFRLRHQDGRWHWVEARSRSLEHDANGQPRLIVGTLLDISARKAGEAERQLADLVFTGISDGICITDAQRKILRINKALTISPVTSRPHLAMQEVAVTQRKLLESEHRRAAAARRNIEGMLAQIIDNDPVPTFVIDARHCITHWNKACATITGHHADEMVGTQKHRTVFYPPDDRPVMADLILDGSIDENFAQYYRGAYRRSPTVNSGFESEAFFPHMGNGRWLFFTAAPLFNEKGERIGAIETLQDVTDRHLAEEHLLAQQNQLEQMVSERTSQLASANAELEADRKALEELLSRVDEAQQQLLQSEKMAAIGQLAAGVAHEINNPVGFVNSNLGTLKTYISQLFAVIDAYKAVTAGGDPAQIAVARQKADLDFLREDLPSLLAESQEGLGRVTKIVQDLKDFSRVDQAEYQLADLNAALESTLNVVWNELKYKAEVVRELGDIPEVECVPAQINQVFMNLLVNAAQAIDTRGRITLRSGAENGHIWFEVADTGRGIPPDICKRIFEPFFTTKPVGKGTGLGLSISYDIIVKKHGGRFDVTSTPGAGTTFKLWLPIRSPEKTS